MVAAARDADAFSDREAEPNDEPGAATPIASGHAVTGFVGKRFNREESDRDWYRLRVEGAAPVTLRAGLTSVPNMNVKLEIYDAMRERLVSADVAGLGHGELVANWRLDPGTHYLLVREVWVAGKAPTENLSDHYRLTATWRPILASDEVEPNDEESRAQLVRTGAATVGFLDRPGDVDFFRASGEGGGMLAGEVTAPAGVDVRIEIVRPRIDAEAPPALHDREGAGQAERFSGVSWPSGGEPPVIAVRRKGPASEDPARPAPPGIDQPYRLLLRVEK